MEARPTAGILLAAKAKSLTKRDRSHSPSHCCIPTCLLSSSLTHVIPLLMPMLIPDGREFEGQLLGDLPKNACSSLLE